MSAGQILLTCTLTHSDTISGVSWFTLALIAAHIVNADSTKVTTPVLFKLTLVDIYTAVHQLTVL